MTISVDTLTDKLFDLSMADDRDEAETAAADLIADIMNTCRRHRLDFNACLERARGYDAYEKSPAPGSRRN